MTFAELLQKRLILLSGKGGVGKTTVAVCLGLLAARLKKKVLLVEMNSTERVAPFFNLKEIGHQEIPLSPYITGINLDPHVCFEEYVVMQIRFKKLFDTFINNRFVTYFLNAVPGLNELLMIGKIYDLKKQKKGRLSSAPLYDLIIVDGPATGHGVSAFEVPTIVNRAVRVGPLKAQSERLLGMLNNKEETAFSVVTLAEEMPATESEELIAQIKQRLDIAIGPLFVNNFFTTDLTDEECEKIEEKMPDEKDPLYPYFAYSKLAFKRSQLNAYYRERLRKRMKDLELITIPHLDGDVTQAKGLAPIIDEWLESQNVGKDS